MNSLFYKLKSAVTRGSKKKRMLLSIVILAEVIVLLVVATYAWVETVSSIKITNETNTKGEIDTYVFTEAMIGAEQGTIDIAKYFKQSGDMHLAPASSADGRTLYFPKANISSNFTYRKGNVSDKNTAYMSVSFKIRTDTNADFFFEQEPTFSALGDDIRVSVTSQSEGSTSAPVTTIYSNNESTTAVVNSTSGATGATTVEKYADHTKGKSSTARLFAVGANETKIVTINIWLQKKTGDVNTDLTENMSQAVTITNFGITSSLTPRHVTLLPTPTWDNSRATFYAWCFDARNGDGSRLYKLTLDENEHYSFNYNGTYQKTTFVRAVPDCTVQPGQYSSWPFSNNTASGTDGYWNQTVDTTIPNDPVDPTYIIETLNSGSNSKSTGSWHDPAIIKVAYTTDQTDTWGTMSATSYVGTTTSTHIIEQTNSDSNKHQNTVHAWPGKKIHLVATAASANYAFEGWYNNKAGTGTALSTSATFTTDAPSTATEITYYAKFKEVRTLTIYRTVDGSTSSTAAAGTITINGSTTANTATSKEVTVDLGSSVTFSATAAAGYKFDGFFTNATGTTTVESPLTIDNNTTYYARFSAKSYNIKTRPYYTNNVGGTSYDLGNTGGTVKTGDATATSGSTTISSESVKFNSSVTLKATPLSGYVFVGWYTAGPSGGTLLSSNAEYTYTLDSADTLDANDGATVYGRFMKTHTTSIYVTPRVNWGNNYYIRLYQGSGNNVIDSNNGFVQATYDSNTGYYKANFTTTKTGTFYAILAKDTNHTDKVPSSDGYQGTLGTNYRFKKDTEGLAVYNNDRCIWFIDGTDSQWIVSDCNDTGNGGTLIRSYYSSLTTMTKINTNCWIYEYSGLTNGSNIYFNQNYKNNDTYEKNHWKATVTSGKNQYTATGGAGHDNYGAGSWTN